MANHRPRTTGTGDGGSDKPCFACSSAAWPTRRRLQLSACCCWCCLSSRGVVAGGVAVAGVRNCLRTRNRGSALSAEEAEGAAVVGAAAARDGVDRRQANGRLLPIQPSSLAKKQGWWGTNAGRSPGLLAGPSRWCRYLTVPKVWRFADHRTAPLISQTAVSLLSVPAEAFRDGGNMRRDELSCDRHHCAELGPSRSPPYEQIGNQRLASMVGLEYKVGLP